MRVSNMLVIFRTNTTHTHTLAHIHYFNITYCNEATATIYRSKSTIRFLVWRLVVGALWYTQHNGNAVHTCGAACAYLMVYGAPRDFLYNIIGTEWHACQQPHSIVTQSPAIATHTHTHTTDSNG